MHVANNLISRNLRVLAVLGAAAFSAALLTLALVDVRPGDAQSAPQASYSVVDLGTLGGYDESRAFDVNDSGQVVGYSPPPNSTYHAFFYTSGTMHDLGALVEGQSNAVAVNNSGQAVGTSYAGDPPDPNVSSSYRAFSSTNGGGMSDLGSLGGHVSRAFDVNDSGQVVGDSTLPYETYSSYNVTHAALFSNGEVRDLGTLSPANCLSYPFISSAESINSAGKAVGWSYSARPDGSCGPSIPVIFENGTVTDLGLLLSGVATAINDSDQIVGRSNSGGFLYQNGTTTFMGSLEGRFGTSLLPEDINNSGKIVGSWVTSSGSSGGFLSDNGSHPTDLNQLISIDDRLKYDIQSARGINNLGEIAAEARISDTGRYRAVLLTPGCDAPATLSAAFAAEDNIDICKPQVKIGTEDDVEPAIETSSFTSTLEVKGVDGLGCSISTCKFEWLRTATAEKQDENFQPSTDSLANDHRYSLSGNGQDDTWHKFKVRATNPETNATAESNVLEVDTIVGRVEAMMRANNWLNGAQFQKKWKEREPARAPNYGVSDIDTIKMDTWVLTFDRARKQYDQISKNLKKNSGKQQMEIAKLLAKKGFLDGQEHTFGDFANDTVDKLNQDHIQSIKVDPKGRGGGRTGGGQADDMLAALATFELKAAVSGTVKPETSKNGKQRFRVQVKEAGIFVEDQFEFENTYPWPQPLGCWHPLTNTVTDDVARCGGTFVDNDDYQEWRTYHGKGGDFMVYSDVKREPLALDFTIEAPPPPK